MTMRIALLCFILAGCSPQTDRTETASSAPAAPAASEIARHVRYLASDELRGRRTGEEGNRQAASYVAAGFAAAGLAPAGDSGGFYQPFTFLKEIRRGTHNALSLTSNGTPADLSTPADFLPLTISPDTDVAGPIVFAGYGISAPKDS